jgi:hypothetical protein
MFSTSVILLVKPNSNLKLRILSVSSRREKENFTEIVLCRGITDN